MPSTATGSVGETSAPNADADRGENGHDATLRHQVIEIDVKRPRKEQRSQHAVKQGGIEVDPADAAFELLLRRPAQVSQEDEPEGEQQRDGHQSDGPWKTQIAVVHPAEERGESRQNREKFEEVHGRSAKLRG
jgi:hypothetical protein